MEIREQGETIPFELKVVDSDLITEILEGAQIVFAYTKRGEETKYKFMTFVDTVAYTELTAEETALMSGTYQYIIKIKDSKTNIDKVASGSFKIENSILPVFPTV